MAREATPTTTGTMQEPDDRSAADARRVPSKGRSRRRRALLTAGVLVVGVLALVAVRYAPLIDALRTARSLSAELVASVGDLGPEDIDAATVAAIRGRVAAMDREVQILARALDQDPLIGVAASVPWVAEQVTGAQALVAASQDVLAAADIALDLGDRFVSARTTPDTGGADLLPAVVEIMATSGQEVDRAAGLLHDAQTSLAAIPPGAVPQIREARDLIAGPLARYRVLLEAYRSVDDRLPAIMGWGGQERRYLVLAQNPAEIRPTGGYIGTIGWIVLRDGALAEMSFQDVYTLDGQIGMPYQEPPAALAANLLGRTSWELADSNWSPDFPTSAADALRLYTLESGDDRIDGVIAITTFALDRFLEVTGPVEVPGYGVTVQPGEVTVKGIAETRAEGPDRKRFVADLAATTLERLLAIEPERWGDLVRAFERTGQERLALAWFRDPRDQAIVAGTRWEGAVRDDAGDFLAISDANVSPSSKLSLVVERATTLETVLAADGSADHRLRTTWRNDGGREGEPYTTLREASEGAGGIYGVFTRMLVPLTSELVEATGESVLPVSGVEDEEQVAGRLAWGNYLLIEPGPAWLDYQWRVPDVVMPVDGTQVYSLTIQKQPGQMPEPMTVRIELPDGAQVVELSDGLSVTDGAATWQGTLTEDIQLRLVYRL